MTKPRILAHSRRAISQPVPTSTVSQPIGSYSLKRCLGTKAAQTQIRRIRGLYHFYAGRTALELDMRAVALEHLTAASHAIPTLWRAYILGTLVRLIPAARAAGMLYRVNLRIQDLVRAILTGDVRLRDVPAKLLHHLRSRSGGKTPTHRAT